MFPLTPYQTSKISQYLIHESTNLEMKDFVGTW